VPTIFSHAIAATALGQFYPERRLPARFWVWTAACAIVADLDVIGFSFGIQYGDMLGHRGLTHSLLFAVLIGAVATATLGAGSHRGKVFLFFTAVAASHGILDAFTNGGRGIAFLAPFSNHRFFFPWRPIQVSPIGVGFFSARGLNVLESELVWILLPSAIIAAVARIMRR
jgi:inner membrane protein